MEISLVGCLSGLLLLLIPLYIVYALDLQRMRSLLRAVGMTAVMMLITGGAILLLATWNNVAVTLLSGLVMALWSSVFAVKKSRLKMKQLLPAVLAGVTASLFVVGLFVCFLMFGFKNALDARLFVPLFGLLAGSIIGIDARALRVYYMGLHHHGQLYHYLLGNGATHREAVAYFVRRSFQAALQPQLRQMTGLGIASAPVVMLSLILGGADVLTAAVVQLLFFVMVLAASLLSLLVALLVGRRYSFDAYERLRPVRATPSVKAADEPVSASSASLSTPHHTDAESRPQAQ